MAPSILCHANDPANKLHRLNITSMRAKAGIAIQIPFDKKKHLFCFRIYDHRMTNALQMCTDLMGFTGDQINF